MQVIKIVIIYCLRVLLRLFYIIPINERKILFVSWKGKRYACNPKYIFEYIYNLCPDKYIYVWSLRNKENLSANFSNVQVCGFLTLNYIYTAMTAKYIVNNMAIEPIFPFRKKQKIIYTWHGGGAYKIEGDVAAFEKRRWSRMIMRDIRSKMISHAISSCEKFTLFHSESWKVSQDTFLPIGMPRNDIFFSHDDNIKDKVYKYYNINNNKKLVLYAPTYRGDSHFAAQVKQNFNLDVEDILRLLKNKYGEDFLFLYRAHYIIKDKEYNTPNIILASDYPDMQELLYAVDILITDYSSSMWDFSFTFKPCFLFTPDLDEYIEKQGFYTPIEEWPFPVAKTNEQLMANIKYFDSEAYTTAVKNHHKVLGSYEHGTATKKLFDMIFNDE